MKNKSDKILLIIDDDDATCFLIKELFSIRHIRIMESANGKGALEIINANKKNVFLVLLDIQLPDQDGFSILKKIRKIKPDAPVIAISALMNAEMYDRCIHKGFNLFIPKPFDIDKLEKHVLFYLEKYNS